MNNNTQKYNQISELIYKVKLNKASDIECSQLEEWTLYSSENKRIYDELISLNTEDILQENESIDLLEGWKALNKKMYPKKKSKVKYLDILRYAAVLLLPISLAAYLFVTYGYRPNDQLSVVNSIKPGDFKAVLYTSNGSVYKLDQHVEDKFIESEGVHITESGKLLDYSKTDSLVELKGAAEEVSYSVIKTPRGGEYSVVLSDGTIVTLNAESEFRYPIKFGGKYREVYLLQGEAFFEVAHNASNPFIVHSGDMKTKVLGTSFNVRAYKNEDVISTTLVEGKVQIESDNDKSLKMTMSPNQQSVYRISDGTCSTQEVNVNHHIAWKDGRFVFYKKPLGAILEDISRWYDVKLFYQNGNVQDMLFTGNMDKYKDIETALRMLEKTNKVKFNIKDNAVLVIKKY